MPSRPLPAPLAPGARVGVVALSGTPDPARLAAGIAVLEEAGYRVVRAPNMELREGYLAGSDDERLAGLDALLDAGVGAIVAARGGYGAMRLLPRLPWARLAAWSGWMVGFSDMTALHAAAGRRLPVATLHGPMGITLASHPGSSERLLRWLAGESEQPVFRLHPSQIVRPGIARGVAVGGNLSILAALVGTSFEPDYDGAVLFLEDVGEPAYRLDRLLTQLGLSSRLARVKAVIVGKMTGCGRGECGWRERWRDLLARVAPASAAVVEGLPFGHGRGNTPFPLGVSVTVDTIRGDVIWGGD